MAKNYDLTEQAAIYGSYHNNKWNKLIHFFNVPLILFGFALWFSIFPVPLKVPLLHQIFPNINPQAFGVNYGTLFWILPALYYCTLDPLVGLIIFILVNTFSCISNVLVFTYGVSQIFYLGLIAQIIGWGFQVVIGHGYFEGRSAAITESSFQAIVSPFFVILEILFEFGYRPKLAAEIHRRTMIKIGEWKASKKLT